MRITDIARTCHEVNRAYCESIGDASQKSWHDAPDWQKQSAIKGIEFAVNNPQATPRSMHESWCREKIATGWQYGDVKDADAKTHPCLVDYDLLPEAQRAKDALFLAVVRSLDGV